MQLKIGCVCWQADMLSLALLSYSVQAFSDCTDLLPVAELQYYCQVCRLNFSHGLIDELQWILLVHLYAIWCLKNITTADCIVLVTVSRNTLNVLCDSLVITTVSVVSSSLF